MAQLLHLPLSLPDSAILALSSTSRTKRHGVQQLVSPQNKWSDFEFGSPANCKIEGPKPPVVPRKIHIPSSDISQHISTAGTFLFNDYYPHIGLHFNEPVLSSDMSVPNNYSFYPSGAAP